MPTVLQSVPARFFFHSNEGDEPVQMHMEKAWPSRSSGWIWYLGVVAAAPWARAPSLGGDDLFSLKVDPRAVGVASDDDDVTVDVADGRRVAVPLAWFPRLLHADPCQRGNWRLIGDGQGIHWPEIDEDISVDGLHRWTGAPDATRNAV